MCGIAGIVMRNPTQPRREAVENMLATIRHRGPDDCGVEPLGSCVLGNVRLAIVDLSERGHQPMSSDDGAVWITYNGECYNAAEWRLTLQSRGRRFRSTSDTEVVLRLYEEFGEDFLLKVRGMFALAIWDARRNHLLLARDRLGIKPLYIAPLADKLIFASELRAFAAGGLISPRLDPRGMRAFLQLGHIPPPWSALCGVEPLAPAEVAIWQDGVLRRSIYWTLPKPEAGASIEPREAVVSRVRHSLLDAARLHRASDVPLAVFLSGGVDSAAVAALMRSADAEDMTALTIGFEEKEFDESDAGSETASQLRLPHKILRLPAAEMAALTDDALSAMDQPTMDGLNTFWISRAAAAAGFKVALSGQGGDELFGGYTSQQWFERFQRTASMLQFLPSGLGPALFDHGRYSMRMRKLSYLVGADDPFAAAQRAVRVLFLEGDAKRLLSSALASQSSEQSENEEHIKYWTRQVAGRSGLEKIAFLDIYAHLSPRLLRDGDAMSMANSVELRPLFLDDGVVDCVMKLPATVRMDRKRLLLDALGGILPEKLRMELAARPKRTFSFPFDRWFHGPWRAVLDSAFDPDRLHAVGVLQPESVRRIWGEYQRAPAKIGWSRIWTLFVLQRWCEIMGVRP
jgi:asparagine synthase (glutamine-hydrolysing)